MLVVVVLLVVLLVLLPVVLLVVVVTTSTLASQVAAMWVILVSPPPPPSPSVRKRGEGRSTGWKDGETVVGEDEGGRSRPHAPLAVSPALRSVPEERRRRVWLPPAAIWVGLIPAVVSDDGRVTGCGVETSSWWPRPSCPEPLEPRAWRRNMLVCACALGEVKEPVSEVVKVTSECVCSQYGYLPPN
jgi:hypothetical protein